jgi:hypothetical protein
MMRAGSRIPRLTRIVVTIVAVAALVACGGDDEPEASPGDEELPGFTEGDFDDVAQNRLPGSEALDEPTEVNGATTASYVVEGPDPEMVVDDLRTRLEADGWNLVEGPEAEGQAVRADFIREQERLEVSAFPAQAFEEDYESPVQYSLVLNDSAEDSRDAGS